MMKKSNIMQTFVFIFAILVTVLLTGLSFNDFTVKAEESNTTSNEESADKTLVQYSNDWTIFQYISNAGTPTFEIYYLDKSIEELESEGLIVKYRLIFKDDNSHTSIIDSWNYLDDPISDKTKNDIDIFRDNYLIQFKIISLEDFSILSVSDSLFIYPTEVPYVMSANFNNWARYDLESNPNTFEVTLKISQTLSENSDVSISASVDGTEHYLNDVYSASNLSYENKEETYTLQGKTYNLQYAIITFDVELSATANEATINSDKCYITYYFKFNGLKGTYSEKELSEFWIFTYTPVVEPEFVYIENIQVYSSYTQIKSEMTFSLACNIYPLNATILKLNYYSDNTSYATVDENGFVTTKAEGAGKYVTITAESTDGSNVKGTYTFYIENTPLAVYPVSGITINSPVSSVTAGEKVALTAIVEPENATNKTITWSSSNEAYATVDSNGIVTTKATGAGKTVTITATSKDGSDVVGSYTLEIKPILVTGIKITSSASSIEAGKKVTLTATVSPANATNKAITWSSSNTKYATVNKNGVVTTKKAGAGKTVIITAKATDGSNQKVSFKLKIKKVSMKKLKITGKKTVKAGKKITLKVNASPSNATNKSVKWTTSNKKYATVSSKGVVTTKKAGQGKTVTITAKAKDGSGKKATIKIKIK